MDGGAVLQGFEEKIVFWQSFGLSLPFWVRDGLFLKALVPIMLTHALKISCKAAKVFEGVKIILVVSQANKICSLFCIIECISAC